MLGFTVRVWEQRPDGDGPVLARWEAWSLRWIDDLVQEGDATMVESNGGYPYRYDISARVLAPILLTTDRDALATYLDVKRWPREPHARVDDHAVRACTNDAVLRLEAWDES